MGVDGQVKVNVVVTISRRLQHHCLASGDLVEPLPNMRIGSPLAYRPIVGPRNAARPELVAFCDWLKRQALLTRAAIGDLLDSDTVKNAD